MEGKTVILSVFIMSLVMSQIQVEALICCPSTTARHIYDRCRLTLQRCLEISGCKPRFGGPCTPPYDHGILENSGNDVKEYCKLGCTSSVCGALITLQNTAASEIVNGAIDKCAKACSTVCTDGSMTAVETV